MALELTVRNNDFSEYDNDPRMSLVRIDRNNTHYYIDHCCPKCGGQGYLPGYEHVEGGICFMCGGTGKGQRNVTVRTYEYNQKLVEARLAKARKTAGERNAKYLKSQGFNEAGETWVVAGDTFKIKDELKAAGARFNNMFLWHFDHEVSEFPTIKVTINDKLTRLNIDTDEYEDTIGHYYNDGTLSFGDEWPITCYIKALREKWEAENAPVTEWYGSIKDKVNLNVTLTRRSNFDTQFGTTFIYTFEDAEGHQLIWKTANWLENKVGENLTIKGTIKAHTEYKGIKQTELTRCKVA